MIKVVLNESNRFNEPTIRKEYPGTTEALKEIQEWAKKNKIYKLDGYDLQERISGGTTYRVRLEYDSGDSITIRWYGHGVDEQASSAYAYVSSYFRPWRERALKSPSPSPSVSSCSGQPLPARPTPAGCSASPDSPPPS